MNTVHIRIRQPASLSAALTLTIVSGHLVFGHVGESMYSSGVEYARACAAHIARAMCARPQR
jgi:hypothetical protein